MIMTADVDLTVKSIDELTVARERILGVMSTGVLSPRDHQMLRSVLDRIDLAVTVKRQEQYRKATGTGRSLSFPS